MEISFARHQFPPDIIRHAAWLYLPRRGRNERRRDLNALVEHLIFELGFARRLAPRRGGHAQHLSLVHEDIVGRVRETDRLLAERICIGRRAVNAHDRVRVMASERVVEQRRQGIGVVRRLG